MSSQMVRALLILAFAGFLNAESFHHHGNDKMGQLECSVCISPVTGPFINEYPSTFSISVFGQVIPLGDAQIFTSLVQLSHKHSRGPPSYV